MFDKLIVQSKDSLKNILKNHFPKGFSGKIHIRKALKQWKKIKKTSPEAYPKLSTYYTKFIHSLNINIHGINALKELLGTNGLHLMGEIQGILPSYTSLQDLQQNL